MLSPLSAHLLDLICALNDPAENLLDIGYATPDDAAIAEHIRAHFDEFSRDDAYTLLSFADEICPITFRANRDANYPALNSALIDIAPDTAAVADYCLN